MKILFLDIDGVLNSDELFRSFEQAQARYEATNGEGRKLFDMIHMETMLDPKLVANLNKVIEATSCKVCLSSSWRTHVELDLMQTMLENKGFIGQLISKTPKRRNDWGVRGLEINDWLEDFTMEHGDLESFAIVDDNDDMEPHMAHLVQTDMAEGLTEEKADELIARLNGEA